MFGFFLLIVLIQGDYVIQYTHQPSQSFKTSAFICREYLSTFQSLIFGLVLRIDIKCPLFVKYFKNVTCLEELFTLYLFSKSTIVILLCQIVYYEIIKPHSFTYSIEAINLFIDLKSCVYAKVECCDICYC